MFHFRLITATTAAVALTAGGVATAADAPVVSAQKTLETRTAPVTIPGTGVKKGEKLPSGARIIYRDVTLEGDQRTTARLLAPKGSTLRGLAHREGSQQVGFRVIRPTNYGGKRRVFVRAHRLGKAATEGTGRIFALIR